MKQILLVFALGILLCGALPQPEAVVVQSTSVSVDVPTGQISNINDAFDANYPGRLTQPDGSGGFRTITKANWTKFQIRRFVADNVRAFIKQKDTRSAVDAATTTGTSAATAIEGTP